MQHQRSSAEAIFWRLHCLSMCSPNMGLLAGYTVIHQHHINVIPTLHCTSSRAASLDFRSLIQESAWYFFWFRSYKLKVQQCTYTTVYCTCNHHNCMLPNKSTGQCLFVPLSKTCFMNASHNMKHKVCYY